MRKYLFFSIIGFIFLNFGPAVAQVGGSPVPMADGLRAEGKIYVVVISLLLVLSGVFGFLLWLERRMKNLEELNTK